MKTRPSFLRSMMAIVRKDLTAEFRSRELITGMLVFALLVILIFNFALDLNSILKGSVVAGVLWVTFTFAGTIGLNRSMAVEKDRGCLDGLLLAPVDRVSIFFGKVIGNLVFMLIVEAIVFPIFSLLYNVNLFDLRLVLIVLLGSVGYVVVGTLLSSMSVHTRTRDVLLPILLFPLILPVVISAVKATQGVLEAYPWEQIATWVNLLIVFDVVYIAVAIMTYDFIVEE